MLLLSPLEQFQILSFLTIELFGFDFSITNALLVNIIALLCFSGTLYLFSSNKNSLNQSSFFFIPNPWQVIFESIYDIVSQLVSDLINTGSEKYFLQATTKNYSIYSFTSRWIFSTNHKDIRTLYRIRNVFVPISNFNMSRRYYHSTNPVRAIEWASILKLKLLGMGKPTASAVCQVNANPLFPGEYFVEGGKQMCGVIYMSAKATLYDALFWKVVSACGVVVFSSLFVGFTFYELQVYMDFINMYNQIFSDPDAVILVNGLPDLSEFNQRSVDLLHAKVRFWSKEKVELLVKFFVDQNIHMYKNVLIDPSNTV